MNFKFYTSRHLQIITVKQNVYVNQQEPARLAWKIKSTSNASLSFEINA
jgi:hypothetical protein